MKGETGRKMNRRDREEDEQERQGEIRVGTLLFATLFKRAMRANCSILSERLKSERANSQPWEKYEQERQGGR